MLPSDFRLRHRSGFGKVYARGRSYVTDLVVVYVLPGRSDVTRIGFSVSKKLGKAVIRNRVKRMLREAARQLLADIARGYDVVVVARRKAAEAPFSEMSAALRSALKKSGVLGAEQVT